LNLINIYRRTINQMCLLENIYFGTHSFDDIHNAKKILPFGLIKPIFSLYERKRNKVKPQFRVLMDDLECTKEGWSGCKKNMRVIDHVLLSIGGNDAGFVKFVTYIAASDDRLKKVLPIFIKNNYGGKIKGEDLYKVYIRFNLESLKCEYENLQYILENDFLIKDCFKGKCPRVTLTSYPDILRDEKGDSCTGNRGAFDFPFGKDEGGDREKRIKFVKKELFEKLLKLQTDQTGEKGWTVVTKHSKKYAKHGFCAQGKKDSAQERFDVPEKKEGKGNWSFDPSLYETYATRERWIRLPIDSKLSINMRGNIFGTADLFLSDETSGIIHPTSEGLSATAEATFQAIKDMK
jgi:hypothetical protein